MEEAFLWFEVEIVKLGDFKDVMNRALMIIYVCTGGDPDIVHIDTDSCTKGLMLENGVAIDVVHHGLKGRW